MQKRTTSTPFFSPGAPAGGRPGHLFFLLAFLLPGLGWAQAPNVTYSAPITITQGGTYTGNFRSTDQAVPVIKVETTQPVIIENCILAGVGNLIYAASGNANIIVRNNRAYGMPQTSPGTRHGRFIELVSASSVRVEHNYLEGTTGINVYQWGGNGTAQQTLTVRYNQSRNIDGRLLNGGWEGCNFMGLNQVHGLVGAEIAWNEIINEPNRSRVEDNINFYNSGGTSASPVQMHDNYIQGAFPFPATETDYTGSGFIIDGDGGATTGSAYVQAYRNQVVATSGAAMNIAAGHDIQYYENRVVSSGLLADGTRLLANWAAVAVWNAYSQASFANNTINNNTIGYYRQGGGIPYTNRQDLSPGACSPCSGNISLPDRPLTVADEQNEFTLWQQKLQQNGVTVGAAGTGTTPPPTATPPTVTLSSPTTGTVGTALSLTASAASAGGTIAKVEFFNGATKLGEDLTAPYALSYVPTAAATLTLTARATDNAGAATSTAATSVTVSAATTTPPTTTPGTTPANSTFVRAINLGGTATTIDGRSWDAASSAANFQTTGTSTFANQNVTLSPATDAARASMIRSSMWGSNPGLAVSGIASGTYSVYLYVWEDNAAATFSISLEGRTVQTNHNSGTAGHWDRLGPFTTAITDGTINIGATGGDANFSGIEIWKQNTTTPVATPPTVTLSSPTTGTVGTALSLTASAASAGGTIAKVEFFNGATKLGEDLTAPYALSYVPTAAATLTLTARATDNAGAATSTAATSVTVSAATTTPPTTTPGTTPANSTFVRAINLGGTATTIDGRSWDAASSAANFQTTGTSTFANQNVTLSPATDAARASMIRSSMWGSNPGLAVSGIASGTYSVYLYVWEDNAAATFSISLEGRTVQTNHNSGTAGHWDRLGPFTTAITDGTINVGSTGGDANFSGIEIWKQPTSAL